MHMADALEVIPHGLLQCCDRDLVHRDRKLMARQQAVRDAGAEMFKQVHVPLISGRLIQSLPNSAVKNMESEKDSLNTHV